MSANEAEHPSTWRAGLSIAVRADSPPDEVSASQLAIWADSALTQLDDPPAALQTADRLEFDVSFVDAERIRTLNRDWRGRDSSTNVLSFPAEMPVLASEQGGALLILGDVVVCPEVITQEARAQGKPLAHHYAHMLVHSLLHLLGMDHQDDRQAETMETLEIRILSTLGIPDPYSIDDAR